MPDAKSTDGKEYGRPLSIEDATNAFFVHPLSNIVVKIALPLKISANFVSVLGLVAGLFAGFLYYHQSTQSYIWAAFAAMVAWHIFDGADGKIARATGTASAFGRILDGICDHLVFGAVYIAFVLYALANGASNIVWGLAVVSAICHAVQSAAYEERRQIYQRRSKGQDRAEVVEDLLSVDGKKSVLASLYDKFQKLSSPGASALDTHLKTLREQGAGQGQIQEIVNKTVKIVKAWGLLNANNRTIMLAIMALLGHPLWYFIYEIVVLSLLFIALLVYERKVEANILTKA